MTASAEVRLSSDVEENAMPFARVSFSLGKRGQGVDGEIASFRTSTPELPPDMIVVKITVFFEKNKKGILTY